MIHISVVLELHELGKGISHVTASGHAIDVIFLPIFFSRLTEIVNFRVTFFKLLTNVHSSVFAQF